MPFRLRSVRTSRAEDTISGNAKELKDRRAATRSARVTAAFKHELRAADGDITMAKLQELNHQTQTFLPRAAEVVIEGRCVQLQDLVLDGFRLNDPGLTPGMTWVGRFVSRHMSSPLDRNRNEVEKTSNAGRFPRHQSATMLANGSDDPESEASIMAIPILPFVAGALVGGLGVYLYRNEKLRRVVGQSASDLSGKVKRPAAQASDDASDGPGGLGENDSSKSTKAPTRKRKTAKR